MKNVKNKISFSNFKLARTLDFSPQTSVVMEKIYVEKNLQMALRKKVPREALRMFYDEKLDRRFSESIESAYDDICEDSPSDLRLFEKSGNFGHQYTFGYKCMPLVKAPESALQDSFSSVVGTPTSTSKSITEGEQEARFGTGDVVILLDNAIKLQGKKFHARGLVALTTSEHSLNGFLIHLALQPSNPLDAQKFSIRIRAGAGAYPIPLLRPIVEKINCQLGAHVWHMTDLLVDYENHGPVEFEKFYGKGLLLRTQSMIEARSYEWALRKNESFLGMGDDVFLGDPSGSYGSMLKTIVDCGVVTRLLQKQFFDV